MAILPDDKWANGCRSDIEVEKRVPTLHTTKTNIGKVSRTNLKTLEPDQPVMMIRNSNIAEFDTKLERQATFKVFADRRAPHTVKNLTEEKIQS